MADQTSQPSTSPSTPSIDQLSMREVAFLIASRRLAAQPHTFKRGQSTESTPLPTPVVSTESEKKRRDDNEVFENILSNLEEGGGLPEAGVVNQPLLMEEVTVVMTEEVAVVEEVVEEETRRSTLAIRDPEETTQVESYEEPIRIALEKVATEKQLEVEEEKKKKRRGGKEGGGLPEAGVVNQPLLIEEVTVVMKEEVAVVEKVVEEETRRSTLAIRDPEETMQVESYEEPIRVALEKVAVEKQLEVEEEKKKKRRGGKVLKAPHSQIQ
ncbi:uncharacterized protein LOC120067674 [Benincasa hispida]|uniref:uncharacterized protein LOC120067674 n=1 Tax=Benincasa hispida TaxID=102211 RepID=UPI00190232AF|nr:uncharacterized protein LOC120067674 [Benincasa hispida]